VRRTAIGYDSGDHELDVVVFPDGRWLFKDDEKMEQRIREGRYSADEVVEIRALGHRLTKMVDAGDAWWGSTYTTWTPDPAWGTPTVPSGWEHVDRD
jgi:protein associated with RNAse G/E